MRMEKVMGKEFRVEGGGVVWLNGEGKGGKVKVEGV